MPAMPKAEVLDSLKSIQRRVNEDALKVLALIKQANEVDGELDTETSATLRNAIYHAENDNIYNLREGLTRLEGKMYGMEERCYWCGDRIETHQESEHDGTGIVHAKCNRRKEVA